MWKKKKKHKRKYKVINYASIKVRWREIVNQTSTIVPHSARWLASTKADELQEKQDHNPSHPKSRGVESFIYPWMANEGFCGFAVSITTRWFLLRERMQVNGR